MAEYKVKINYSGVGQLLHEIGQTACKQKADEICDRCGDGYATDVKRMSSRTIASVYTDTFEAMADNQAHDTLKGCLR